MHVRTILMWLVIVIAPGSVAALVSNGFVQMLAIIGIFLIGFVLQGTIVKTKVRGKRNKN